MAKAENPLTEELAKFVQEKLGEWKVPGISVGVIDHDQVFTAGYGIATLPDTPATPETLWYAGSTTKAFTAAVIAHLIDSKKYPALVKGWQTTISSILREDFVLQDEWATNHLTLEDAVAHRTGMPRHDQSASRLVDDDGGKRHATVRDVTRNLRNLRLSEEPRVKFQYCNLMYGVLSHVVETVTGRTLGDVMREVIFEPLGMTSTYLSLDDARASPKHLAAGYYWDQDTGMYVLVEDVSVLEHGGAGAIISNAEDYAKWAKCMLLGEAPFSEAVHRDIRTPRIVQQGMSGAGGKDVTTYALGWERVLYHGHLMYSHSGGMMAAGSAVVWLPDDKLGLVAFGNTSITSHAVIDTVLYKLIDDKLGIAPGKGKNPAKEWRSVIDHWTRRYDKAMDNLFPNRPNPPIPSPVSVKDLAGRYYDPGYKTIELRAADKQGEEVLVAEREDASWTIHMRLHHVSGAWWIMYALEMGSPNLFRETEQVEFKIGHDGRVTALEVDFYTFIGDQHQGKVVFNRVNES